LPLRSLRALAIAFLLAFLLITIGTGMAIFTATHATIVAQVDKRILSVSDNIAGTQFPARRSQVLARIAEILDERDTGDLGIELEDGEGRRLAGNMAAMHRRLPSGFSTLDTEDGIPGLTDGRALVREIGNGMTLTVIAETEPVDNYNAERLRIYVTGFGAIILLVVVALMLLMRTISRRITALNMTAEAIIDGDLRSRVPTSGVRSEFDEQARIFNRMLDRIGELMAEIGNISNDIAHDLRTPLARLRNQLTQIERQASTPELRAEAAAAIAQGDQLLEMFAAVLRIAEIDAGDRRAGFAPLDLAALAEETGGILQPVAEESDHQIDLTICEAAPVTGDRQLLTQAIHNLIENALRHTPPGTHIALSVTVSGDQALLAVADNGPGIPEDQRERALRRFGRVDKSRTRPGHGLGLPLVDAIARLHRGTLALGDAGPGLVVTMTLPLRD